MEKRIKFKDIPSNQLLFKDCMKILIDDNIEMDLDGNYLINVAYRRVSTDKQAEEGYGLENQEDDIIKSANSRGLTNLILFTDDGYTGVNLNRPAIQSIIEIIQRFNNGRTKVRVKSMTIARIDRLARSLFKTLEFVQDYIMSAEDSSNSTINTNRHAINFYSADSKLELESNNPQSKLMTMLLACFAEYDREMILKKTKAGRRARVASGKWMGGGNVPYGYRYDTKQSKLIVIPEEAQKIKEIFRLYLEEKMSPYKISQQLGFKGERIVRQILERKSLTGSIFYKGEEFKGEHEAIISLETWEKAQAEIKNRSVFRGDSEHLLSSLVWCGECGAKMRYQKWSSGKWKLICYSRQKSKAYLVKDENCKNNHYWANEVENAVIQYLQTIEHFSNAENKKSSPFIDPLEDMRNRLKKAQRGYSNLMELAYDSELMTDELRERIKKAKKEIDYLKEQIFLEEKEKRMETQRENMLGKIRSIKYTWDDMTPKERQTACRELIESITIYKEGRIDIKLKMEHLLKVTNQ